MPQTIGIADVDRLLAQGAQLVEVLPHDDYEWAHLPGARNIPLKELEEHLEQLDRTAAIIVYCHDSL